MSEHKMNIVSVIPPLDKDCQISEVINNELGRRTCLTFQSEGEIEVYDGYHTITELYEHRYALFCALCKIYDNYITPFNTRVHCWKSKLHEDGTMFEGHFIAGMTISQFDGTVKYITYHMPLSWWKRFRLIEMEKAPKYDGHTPNDVLKTLEEL